MKRFLLIVLPLLGGFSVFSYLAGREPGSTAGPAVFVDERMTSRELVTKDIDERLRSFERPRPSGRSRSFRRRRSSARARGRFHPIGSFDPAAIESSILSNPDALYVTDRDVSQGTYLLRSSIYRFEPVAVRRPGGDIESLDGASFDELLLGQRGSYDQIAEGVAKGVIPAGVIPSEKLSLELEPLRVDGVFPSFGNMRSGAYPKVVRAFVYTRARGRSAVRGDALLAGPGDGGDRFSIIAGGDVMLARGAGSTIAARGADHPFREVKAELERHDIACANLESPVSSRGRKFLPVKGIYFRADPGVVRGIAESGLDFLSLANNHALDWGPDALSDTMRALRAAGILHAGAGATVDEAARPAVFDVRGRSVAFIALNDVYPFACEEGGKKAVTLGLGETTLGKRIAELKGRYDVVVATVHAGVEYQRRQEEAKERAFRHLVDLGVDVVLGHHPHVVQGVEIYKGRVIAYSMGNFIFDQDWSPETSEGLLLEVGFRGGMAVYCNPMPISIRNAQARLLPLEGRERL